MGYINRHKVFFAVQKKVYPANFQEKTITPNTFQKEITPDVGYDALSEVKLHGILVDPHSDIESQNDNSFAYQKVIPNNVLNYGGLAKLGGLTKKYNQLISKDKILPSSQFLNLSFTNNNDGSFTLNGTASSTSWQRVSDSYTFDTISGHKYIMLCITTNYTETSSFYIMLYGTGISVRNNQIVTATSNVTNNYIQFRITEGTIINNARFYPMLVDLTDIYGAGNEPTSVDAFLTDYPKFRNYVPYNTGALDYAYTKKVDIKGFNIWDEQWEQGMINSSGVKINNTHYLRSKNYIKVLPNTTYFINSLSDYNCSQPYLFIAQYDSNQTFIKRTSYNFGTLGIEFTIENNCAYIMFAFGDYSDIAIMNTYNNDVCINVSNATLNGTYKPYYNNALLEAKIIAIKQKLIQLGYSTDVLGYGLNNIYNYIDLENKQVVLNMNDVDLGTANWDVVSNYAYIFVSDRKQGSSIEYILSKPMPSPITNFAFNSANSGVVVSYPSGSFTTTEQLQQALNGIVMFYELATPITVDISDILDNDDIIGLLESGGTITFENDEKYNLPSDVTYLVEVE